MSYPGHSLWGFYPSAEVQSVYSTATADWAKKFKKDIYDFFNILTISNETQSIIKNIFIDHHQSTLDFLVISSIMWYLTLKPWF